MNKKKYFKKQQSLHKYNDNNNTYKYGKTYVYLPPDKRKTPITIEEKLRSRQNSFIKNNYQQYQRRQWFKRFPKKIERNNMRPFLTLWHGYHKSNVMKLFTDTLKRQFRHFGWFYRFAIHQRPTKYKKPSKYLVKKLKLLRIRLFYGIFSHRKYVRLLKNKARASSYQTYLFSLMERRLDVILYRSGFCKSIYTAQQLVRHGHVKVENKIIRNFYYPINFYQKVTFATPETMYRMQYNYLIQLQLNRLRFAPIQYLIVDYLFMFFYIRPFYDCKSTVTLPPFVNYRHLSIR